MENPKPLTYHLCPSCFRAVPAASREFFCPNDGTEMFQACPCCGAAITSPYSRFCTRCGREFINTQATMLHSAVWEWGEDKRKKL